MERQLIRSRSIPVGQTLAQATGKLPPRLDRCDALVLPAFGAASTLETRAPASETIKALKELVNTHNALRRGHVASPHGYSSFAEASFLPHAARQTARRSGFSRSDEATVGGNRKRV